LVDSDLTTGDILGMIKKIAIPSSVGFLFNTLFNVVDTYYAGKIDELALSGLSISFPIFFILIALGVGMSTGLTALLSISIGKKEMGEFHRLCFNATVLTVCISAIFTIGSFTFSEILFRLVQADGLVFIYGTQYMNVIFLGSFFFLMNAIFSGILSAQGDTKSYRNILILGFLLNLFLDPLLTMGWFQLPRLGTMGIAIATILSQCVGFVYMFKKLLRSPRFEGSTFTKQKFCLKTQMDILCQGIPATINMASIAVGFFFINLFVMNLGGDLAIAAFGVAIRVEQIALLPAIGLNIAVLAIVGQNFGAGHFERIRKVIRTSLIMGIGVLSLGIVILYPLASDLIGFFQENPRIIEIGTEYLRIELMAFYTYVIINVLLSGLQGIKKPYYAIWFGLYRQVLLPVPVFYYLGITLDWGLEGVWWGIVFINWSAAVLAWIVSRKVFKNMEESNRVTEVPSTT
jgi:putative MATE family efflux protein